MSNALQTAFAPKGDADQRVYTSVPFIERLILPVWPEGIAYDPFPGAMAPLSSLAERCCRGDGFVEPLVDRSFANPPFKRLKEAMQKFADVGRERWGEDGGYMLLGPAQVHRSWFWENRGAVVAYLKQIKFHGFTDTYPKPLALHYWGARTGQFRLAAERSGMVVHLERTT